MPGGEQRVNAQHGHGGKQHGGGAQLGVGHRHHPQHHDQHRQWVKNEFAHGNLRHHAAQTLDAQAHQRAANDKQGHGAGALREQGDGAAHGLGQLPAQQRRGEARGNGHDHRVAQQARQRLAQAAQPMLLAARFVVGQGQQDGQHQQVFNHHAQGQGHARHRAAQHQQGQRVADVAAVGARQAHGKVGLLAQVAVLDKAHPGHAAQHDHQRTQRIGQQVVALNDLRQGPLRQRIEQHGRQRKVDDKLAQHPHVGFDEKPETRGQKADANGQVNRQGQAQNVGHQETRCSPKNAAVSAGPNRARGVSGATRFRSATGCCAARARPPQAGAVAGSRR